MVQRGVLLRWLLESHSGFPTLPGPFPSFLKLLPNSFLQLAHRWTSNSSAHVRQCRKNWGGGGGLRATRAHGSVGFTPEGRLKALRTLLSSVLQGTSLFVECWETINKFYMVSGLACRVLARLTRSSTSTAFPKLGLPKGACCEKSEILCWDQTGT